MTHDTLTTKNMVFLQFNFSVPMDLFLRKSWLHFYSRQNIKQVRENYNVVNINYQCLKFDYSISLRNSHFLRPPLLVAKTQHAAYISIFVFTCRGVFAFSQFYFICQFWMDSSCYAVIRNIPGFLHSKDLRRYFSSFTENGKFDCFHFRHRPERKSTKVIFILKYFYLCINCKQGYAVQFKLNFTTQSLFLQ